MISPAPRPGSSARFNNLHFAKELINILGFGNFFSANGRDFVGIFFVAQKMCFPGKDLCLTY
jgi:hypothetical protein